MLLMLFVLNPPIGLSIPSTINILVGRDIRNVYKHLINHIIVKRHKHHWPLSLFSLDNGLSAQRIVVNTLDPLDILTLTE